MNRRRKRKARGVTLVMITGVLSIMAALAATFYSVTIMSARASMHYGDSVRAELVARAGIFDAVGRLREQTFISTESPTDEWFTVNYLKGGTRRISFPARDKTETGAARRSASYSRAIGNSVGPDSDRFTLNISDAASKINVNACDNLGVLLDNLCRVIGPPLQAADLDAIQPRRWAQEGAPAFYATALNKEDVQGVTDLCYRPDGTGPPIAKGDRTAMYGDGYAIARYRSRYGRFRDINDVKNALTFVSRSSHPELEQLEREIKFTAIKEYLTVDSWVDTNTVCVGKFEWARDSKTLIDRDKSWIADDPEKDPDNHRGSLRGSYVSIMNGHGAGQLRRIKTNGIDWIQVDQDFVVLPGPISSYMIIAKEDAQLDSDGDPMTDSAGDLIDDPKVDYRRFPLCIHRAPVNINTASDKVLAAMFLGINIQHGTPLALGTDADVDNAFAKWSIADPLKLLGRIPTFAGLKRVPMDSGKPVLDRPEPWTDTANFGYINNFGALSTSDFVKKNGVCNEAHELAYRIISARQRTLDPKTNQPTLGADPDPITRDPESGFAGYERGPFKSWDDFYFRVVRPWDDIRSYAALPDPSLPGRTTIPHSGGRAKGLGKASLAAMVMAHFNSNTDIVKFNPNIEWVDRWGRNFTSMEPVMAYNTDGSPRFADGVHVGPTPEGVVGSRFYFIRNMRYRIEEMTDKTDLNRSTTEFTMDSGGVFEIRSMGQVFKDGIPLAERKMEALVQVYDVWRESTQRQFVKGTISRAANQALSWTDPKMGNQSGTIGRDGTSNVRERLALTTMPEPLVPLQYRLQNNSGGRLEECVDDMARDARKNPKGYSIPDTIANKILPAAYDGQIVLATNINKFEPGKDTFLASFNGDLDTDTCVGNGREQSKTPENPQVRACDTIGLLGLMNDKEIDIDPFSYPVFSINVSMGSGGVGSPLGPLDVKQYSSNVTCRMGDLRVEGVYCGVIGTAAKDATLKYPIGKGPASARKTGNGPASTLTYQNYDPRAGSTVGMWFKPVWHANDHLEHEFFNGGSHGDQGASRGNKLCKNGYVQGGNARNGGRIGWPVPDGTLWALAEDTIDNEMALLIHSGTDQVPQGNLPPRMNTETPAFHTQPFRWSYIGAVFQYENRAVINNPSSNSIQLNHAYGIWHEPAPPGVNPTEQCARNLLRPFISTYRYPEGDDYKIDSMWVMVQNTLAFTTCDLDGQPATYTWQKSNNARSREGCFSVNNVNEGDSSGPFLHIYRQTPLDSTYSLIDEMKISKRALTPREVGEIMTTSRYYLLESPADHNQLPTFTSQTLMQSLYGTNAIGRENVLLARVNWNVFTPRFMHEHKKGVYSRNEVVNGVRTAIKFHGPFDYAQYNADIDYDHDVGWKSETLNPRSAYLGVNRLPAKPGRQSHYSKGVEIELLNGERPVAGSENSSGNFVATYTFRNPDVVNGFHDPQNSGTLAIVPSDQLRYRVRFVYPIDKDVDPKSQTEIVDPAAHFLLDTPVFDDISITYMTAPRIIYFHEATE